MDSTLPKRYRYRVDVSFEARDDVEARGLIESFQSVAEEEAMFHPSAQVVPTLHELFATRQPRPVKIQ